jgi:O-acetyl-ADP-ribose deacetylase (regulator of RNase III)
MMKEHIKGERDDLAKPYIFDRDFWMIDKTVIYLPTKIHWKNPSQYAYINASLSDLIYQLLTKDYNIFSIAFPAIGCGLGGLEWEKVQAKINACMTNINKFRTITWEFCIPK